MMKKHFFWGLAPLILLAAFLTLVHDDVATADETAVEMTDWSNFNRLSISGQKAALPSIALQPNGNLHVAFTQGAPNEDPYYVTSTDGGATWSTPQVISTNSATTIVDKVDVAVDNNGKVHAAWIEDNTSNNTHTLMYASQSGSSWGPAEPVATVTKSATSLLQQPSLVVSGGQVFMVWTSGIDVQFAQRQAGAIWTPQKIGEYALPEIAIDDTGALHIVFVDELSKNFVQYIQSSNNGATWSNAIALSPFAKDVQDITLITNGTAVHVAYGAKDTSASPSVAYYANCSSNCTSSASWSAGEVVTSLEVGTRPADAILLSPSIALTAQDEPLIFYHGVLPENLNFEQVIGSCYDADRNQGKNFKLPTPFTERMVKPQIVYANGDLHVVYERIKGQAATATFQEIHYAKLDVSCHTIYLPIIFK